jgi:RHS repeat-associated protein
VLGGNLRVTRTYRQNHWQINERWNGIALATLHTYSSDVFQSNRLGIDTITRNGFSYAGGSGSSVHSYDLMDRLGNVYVADEGKKFIKLEDGVQWKDKHCNWIEYKFGEKYIKFNRWAPLSDYMPTSYGSKNESARVTLLYDFVTGLDPSVDNSHKRLVGAADANGNQVLWFEYNAKGYVTAARDYTNRRVEYQYSNGHAMPNGQPYQLLTGVVDVRGKLWQYEYDGKGKIIKKIDPENRVTTITYEKSSVKSVLTTEHGSDKVVGYTYSYSHNPSTHEFHYQKRSTGGSVLERWYDDTTGIILREDINGKTRYTANYDNATRKKTYIDADGNKVVNTFDDSYNLLAIENSDGTSRSYEYGACSKINKETDERGIINQYKYDSRGNLVRKTEAVGTPVERITEYTRNQYGYITEKRILADAYTPLARWRYTYDNFGNRITVTDPENYISTFTYDADGNVLTFTDAKDKTWTYTYDASGRLLTVTDPLNRTKEYARNGVGDVTSVTAEDDTVTRYEYDGLHNLASVIDAEGGASSFEYNLNGLKTKQIDENGHSVELSYDTAGNLLGAKDDEGNIATLEYDDKAINIAGAPSRLKYLSTITDFQYDKRYRKIRDIYRSTAGVTPQVTGTEYDAVGNIVKTTDAEGRETKYEYDALNRLTQVTDALNGVTKYTYDNRDNVLSVRDANTGTTNYTYDRRDNLTSIIRPLGEITSFVYDERGYLVEQTDANGDRIAYEYNDAGYNTVEQHYRAANLQTPIKTIAYTYNARGSITGYSDGSVSAIYEYDNIQRKTRETINYGTFSLEHRYTYLPNGNIATFTGPDGVTVSYGYDKANRLKTVSIPGEGTVTYNEYYGGTPNKITLPGGGTQLITFDALARPVALVSKDGAGNSIFSQSLAYNQVNNIVSKTTDHDDYHYTYDALDRLTAVDNPALPDESYTYDAIGNQLTKTISLIGGGDDITETYQYNQNNELLNHGDTSYVYDNNGNRTEKTQAGVTTHYQYSVKNELTDIQDASQATIAHYDYDPYSYRLKKEANNETRYFHYSDEGLAGEFNQSGELLHSYGYAADNSLWQTNPLYQRDAAEGYQYYHNDLLGTPQKTTNSNGAVTWSAHYAPFGDVTEDVSAIENPLRFAGQYEDDEAGLHYNHLRTYDPVTGRYLQTDPLGLPASMNLYGYADGNPIGNIDPHGEAAIVYVVIGIVVIMIAQSMAAHKARKAPNNAPGRPFPWPKLPISSPLICLPLAMEAMKDAMRPAKPLPDKNEDTARPDDTSDNSSDEETSEDKNSDKPSNWPEDIPYPTDRPDGEPIILVDPDEPPDLWDKDKDPPTRNSCGVAMASVWAVCRAKGGNVINCGIEVSGIAILCMFGPSAGG